MHSTVFPEARRPHEFFAKVASMITPGVSVHHGHMPEITLTSWETATGIWAMYDYVETDNGSIGFHGYGHHYYEAYVKDPVRGWLISTFELRRLRLDRFGGGTGATRR
jgi:SnoaL-like protein